MVYFDIFLYILMYFGSPGVPRNRELRVTGSPGSRTGSGLLSTAHTSLEAPQSLLEQPKHFPDPPPEDSPARGDQLASKVVPSDF